MWFDFVAAIVCPPIDLMKYKYMERDSDDNTALSIVTYSCVKPST